MICVISPPFLQMQPSLSHFFILFFLILSHRSLCVEDYRYSNCTSSSGFECGHELGKTEYPFWVSGHQPEYCGHPSFKLDCVDDEYAVIEITSQRYKVLQIDYGSQILKIVTIKNAFPTKPLVCPELTDMDSTVFFRHNSNVQRVDFTLTYNCSANYDDPPESYNFSCKIDDKDNEAYLTTNKSLAYELESRCQQSEVIPNFPVLVGELEGLANGSLDSDRGKILRAGFEVRWIADDKLCQKCIRSGGTCGFDNISNKTCCFCRDKPHQTTCSSLLRIPSADPNSGTFGHYLNFQSLAIVENRSMRSITDIDRELRTKTTHSLWLFLPLHVFSLLPNEDLNNSMLLPSSLLHT